ncbi:MAG: 1-acyl-sn-glycerol-3-phosphate acyltransferase [Gemmatimonadaceae bacterium]
MLGWLLAHPWIAGAAAVAGSLVAGRRWLRRWANRAAARAALRHRARIDRFKLTRKPFVTAALLADERVAQAVREHAVEHHLPKRLVWQRVEEYVDEIVPFFNIIAYYKIGHPISRLLLNLFYKVTVEHAAPGAQAALPRDAIVVYLMNHRSNADYVLVGYALSGRVAISYAVGEWARAFPLEHIFKSFGAYFIRRRYREPLYHTVLERYVQLITRHGVTQGIFPEGGLTRDGRLRPAKIGLLDYILGVGRDGGARKRMYVVPVAINYDRVLEDRSLLRELEARGGGRRTPLLQQLAEVTHYVLWNAARLLGGRWKRYGRAAVTIGEPVPLAPWFAEQERRGASLFDLPRPERLARVQALADDAMSRIGAIIPVTPVPLACAAIQSLGADFIGHRALLERMEEMRDVLVELNARVLRADRDIAETFDRAWRMLRMRQILVRQGEGYAVLGRQRQLVAYYANSIAHLLGPFEAGVRARDILPLEAILD